MQEVAQEIQAIRKGYEEALETQRHDFQIELERVNGRLDRIEARSTTSINEITVSKAQKNGGQPVLNPRYDETPGYTKNPNGPCTRIFAPSTPGKTTQLRDGSSS